MKNTSKEKITKMNIVLILLLAIIAILVYVNIFTGNGIINNIYGTPANRLNEEVGYNVDYKVYDNRDLNSLKLLVTFTSNDGIEYVKKSDGTQINTYGSEKLSIDYNVPNNTTLQFAIKTKNGHETPVDLYIKNQYKITYNLNGGQGETEGTKLYDDHLALQIPTKEGYSFLGWNTDNGTRIAYKKGEQYTNNKEITLYAVWGLTPGDFTYYKEEPQEFVAEKDGYYKLEVWGASGGYSGNGGYSVGEVYLEYGEKLYVYIGETGSVADLKGRYNGGGRGNTTRHSGAGGSIITQINGRDGGGATDIRLKGSQWNDDESLLSRIIVAGGGRRRLSLFEYVRLGLFKWRCWRRRTRQFEQLRNTNYRLCFWIWSEWTEVGAGRRRLVWRICRSWRLRICIK